MVFTERRGARVLNVRAMAIGLAVTVIVVDQATKAMARGNLEDVVNLTSFIALRLGFNPGVTFGLFAGSGDMGRWVLSIVSLLIIAVLSIWAWRTRRPLLAAGLSLMVGGALGNLLDRLRFGHVTDFIDLHWGDAHWPTFNLADAAIVCGIGLLLLASRSGPNPGRRPPRSNPPFDDGAPEKKSIAVRSALAIGVTASSLTATWLWIPPAPFGVETDMATADRLAYALKWELPVLVWLAGCLRLVASIRYRSDEDRPGAAYGPPSARLAVPAAVLQNSLEQTVLAVGAHLILAVVLRGEELILIPALVTLYLLGRVMFAIGYAKGAAARAFGMALTGASTLAAMVIAIVLLILGR